MAESACEVARSRNNNKNPRLMSENGDFVSASRGEQGSDDGLNLKSIFYLNNLKGSSPFDGFTVEVDNDGGNSSSGSSSNGSNSSGGGGGVVVDDGNNSVNRDSGFCPHVVDGFPAEYKGICPNNDENCRKKRCSDRYDSSESSDSGIAVSSSASSGTSDITDPGSPFSTSSDDSSSSPTKCKEEKRCKSEEKSPPGWTSTPTSGRCRSEEKTWTSQQEQQQQQHNDKTDHNFITPPETDFKMAPNVPSASSPCGIWTSITENNTANETAHFNNNNNNKKFDKSEAIINNNNNNNTKRLKIDGVDGLTIDSYIAVVSGAGQPNSVADVGKSRRSSCDKSTATVAPVAKTCEKSVGCVAKPKQDRTRHQGKITEYFKSQIKSLAGVKREYGCYAKTKDVAVMLHSKRGTMDEAAAKKLRMSATDGMDASPVFVKPSPKHLQTVMPLASKLHLPKIPSKTPDFLTKKPPETKTLFNKILQNHKNRKLAEMKSSSGKAAAVVIVAPASSTTSSAPPPKMTAVVTTTTPPVPEKPVVAVAAMTGEASTTTGAPTVSSPSPATDPGSKDADRAKPYDISTTNATNTELPNNHVVDELSSNLVHEKVQNKELDLLKIDSKQTDDVVKCELVISNVSAGGESAGSNDSVAQSPILTAPKTIRFPARCQTNGNQVDSKRVGNVVCRWDSCSVECSTAAGLLEHLQSAHVLTQVTGEKFVCLWVGCKVFDQKSCSRSWLERHVLSHAGNKPYRCIVDGCGQGFSSQTILERHVNNHFQADVKKALDSPLAHKLFRRNGKKIRYRRQPWSARMFDFFDSGVMEALEYRLVKLTKIRTAGDVTDTSGKSLALTSQVVARRMTANGRQQFLLRWHPQNIVEDEWVYEKDVVRKKIVSIPSLSPAVSSSLQDALELVARPPSSCMRTSRRKNKMNYEAKPKVETEDLISSEVAEEPVQVMVEEVDVDKAEESSREAEAVPVTTDAAAEEATVKSASPPPPSPLPQPTSEKKETDLKMEAEPCLPQKTSIMVKRVKKRKRTSKTPERKPAVSVPVIDSTTTDDVKVVSLKPKEDEVTGAAPPTSAAALPEEVPLVPAVCPPTEEFIPVQTGGIIVDSTKLLAPVKTDMILGSPVKLVTSQYIEQPFVQTVMPVQMPVAYQIPIVKFTPPSPGMFLPQIPNYIIPPSPPAVFPTSPVSAFRSNGFQLSATGTIQIQTSSTTLQQTSSNFVQSTNASGFQIVQSPVALPQSILAAFQNSGIANLGLKSSPTLRLLNCQPLILNKPVSNVSMTVTNVTTTRTEPNGSVAIAAVPPPAIAQAVQQQPQQQTTGTADHGKSPRKMATPTKKLAKPKLTILPKPNISPKTTSTSVSADVAGKSKKQCLQPCGPTTRAAT